MLHKMFSGLNRVDTAVVLSRWDAHCTYVVWCYRFQIPNRRRMGCWKCGVCLHCGKAVTGV